MFYKNWTSSTHKSRGLDYGKSHGSDVPKYLGDKVAIFYALSLVSVVEATDKNSNQKKAAGIFTKFYIPVNPTTPALYIISFTAMIHLSWQHWHYPLPEICIHCAFLRLRSICLRIFLQDWDSGRSYSVQYRLRLLRPNVTEGLASKDIGMKNYMPLII
ncbi:MAG: hypothetical protein IPH18_18030 [Chitinophagaceae bacterium]|nr:hypothetical protein [Chitinophagaceae bacterium]